MRSRPEVAALLAVLLAACAEEGGVTSGASGSASGGSAAGGSGPSGTGGSIGEGGAGGSAGEGGSSSSQSSSQGGSSEGGAGGAATFCQPGSETSCYDGPPGTENKGICASGIATCLPDGSAYGECLGQVHPGAENCATAADEDCDGQAPACTGAGLWSARFGEDGQQYGSAIASDTAGNLFVGGIFGGTIDFGFGVHKADGSKDMFLAKLDSTGKPLWSKAFIALGTQPYLNAVAVDEKGLVYITGFFYGNTSFGGPLFGPQGGGDIYLVCYDGNGVYQWGKRFGDSDSQSPYAMAARPGGGVVLTGTFAGTVNFGGNNLSSTSGSSDVWVASFDSAGNHQWSNRFGDGGIQQGRGIAADAAGNVYLAATAYGTIKFGPDVLDAAGTTYADIALAKFDATGKHVWSKLIGNDQSQEAGSLAARPDGTLVLTGKSHMAVDFGDGNSVAPPGPGGFFFASYDSAGKLLWVNQYANGYSMPVAKAAIDGFGNAVMAGHFVESLNLGGNTLVSQGAYDVYVLKVDAAGKHVWSKGFGDSDQQQDYQQNNDLTIDGADRIAFTGLLRGTADFGSGDLVEDDPYEGGDVYVATLAP